MENLHDFRKNYTKFQLNDEDLIENPLNQFNLWFQEAISEGTFEANAMVVSTVNVEGKPSSRVVLLKKISDEGFIFYTNYNSRKGNDLSINANASILFFWEKFERQIRIEGIIEKVSEEMSIAYFKSRPRASQIGAIVSNQSEEISNRKELEDKFEELKILKKIDKPEDWGGYILKPSYFEFWQGRANRLHDRIVYKMQKNNWIIKRLNP